MTVPTRSPPASITNDASSSLTAVPTSAQPAASAASAAPQPSTTATPPPPPRTTTTPIPKPPPPPPPAVAPFPKVLTPSSPAPSLSSACSMSTSSSTASTSTGSTKALTTNNNPNDTDATMDTDAEDTAVNNDNNNSSAKRVRQGDAQWMKVMETKENQWRYLHSLALHEMNSRERAACDQLHGLCSRLNELAEACDKTERVVRRCRTHRFQQEVVRVAAKPVQQAVAHLSAARYISGANDMVDTMQHSIKVVNNNNNNNNNMPTHNSNNKSSGGGGGGGGGSHNHDHVLAELEKFRFEALRFRTVAKDVGLVQLIGLASSLEKLADMVADEAGAVNDTARRVKQSGRTAEVARSKLLNDVVQQRAKLDAKAGCVPSTDGQQEHRHLHHHHQQQPQQDANDQRGDRRSSVSSSARPSS